MSSNAAKSRDPVFNDQHYARPSGFVARAGSSAPVSPGQSITRTFVFGKSTAGSRPHTPPRSPRRILLELQYTSSAAAASSSDPTRASLARGAPSPLLAGNAPNRSAASLQSPPPRRPVSSRLGALKTPLTRSSSLPARREQSPEPARSATSRAAAPSKAATTQHLTILAAAGSSPSTTVHHADGEDGTIVCVALGSRCTSFTFNSQPPAEPTAATALPSGTPPSAVAPSAPLAAPQAPAERMKSHNRRPKPRPRRSADRPAPAPAVHRLTEDQLRSLVADCTAAVCAQLAAAALPAQLAALPAPPPDAAPLPDYAMSTAPVGPDAPAPRAKALPPPPPPQHMFVF